MIIQTLGLFTKFPWHFYILWVHSNWCLGTNCLLLYHPYFLANLVDIHVSYILWDIYVLIPLYCQ